MTTVVPRRRGRRQGGSRPRGMMHPVTRRSVGSICIELFRGGNASLQSPAVRYLLPCSLQCFAVRGLPSTLSYDSELHCSVPKHACYSSISPRPGYRVWQLTVSSLSLQRYPRLFLPVSHIQSTGSFSYKLSQITYGENIRKRNTETRKQGNKTKYKT